MWKSSLVLKYLYPRPDFVLSPEWVIFHCTYVPHFYPFVSWRPCRLLLRPGYCNAVLLCTLGCVYLFKWHFHLATCLGVRLRDDTVLLVFVFQGTCLLLSLHQLTLPPTVEEGSLFSTPSPAFIGCRFFWWWPFWPVVPHRCFEVNFGSLYSGH